MFLDEVKKGRWHPDKILISWDVCVYEVGKEVALASPFLSLKDPRHDRSWVSFFFSWGLAGAEAVLVAVWQVMVLSSNVSSVFPSRSKSIY